MDEDSTLSEQASPEENHCNSLPPYAGEKALMPSGSKLPSPQTFCDDSSDDDEGIYVGEYFYSYGDLNKKRIRVTVLEKDQKKILKWESNFKKSKSTREVYYQSLLVHKETVDGVFADCNSFFVDDYEGEQNAKDLVESGVGSIGRQDSTLASVQKKQNLRQSSRA